MSVEAYTIASAAAATGLSARTIDRATKAKDAANLGAPVLPSKWLGGRRIILAADLRAWLKGLPDA